jgi:flagellar basal body L-ring protein FlgH
MKRVSTKIAMCLVVVSALAGCAKMVGGLRKDFDDRIDVPPYEPTYGGQARDAGFLDTPGHSDRSPASTGSTRDPVQAMWATPENYQPTPNREMGAGGPPSSDQYADFMPATQRQYSLGHRATKNDFRDDNQNEGSLWASSGQTNYFFVKNKIKAVGDVVTVNAEEDIVKNAVAEIKKTLSNDEIMNEIKEAQKRIDAEHSAKIEAQIAALSKPAEKTADPKTPVAVDAKATESKPATTEPDEAIAKQIKALREQTPRKATWSDIDVSGAVAIKPGDAMMGEVIERFPNGNYKIRATKKVPFRENHRLVSIVGVVKPGDLTEDDRVNSGKLYEYQLKTFR